jgi:integrase
MAEKRTLNDRLLKALPPADEGQRYEIMDTVVPGFGVRITDKGHKVGNRTLASHAVFILVARYPGSANPTRSSLGQVGAIDLADARQKARGWLELIKAGKDPRNAEKQAAQATAQAELQQRKNTFAAVAEDFINEKLPHERKGKEVKRDIRRDLIPELGATPLTQVSDLQILRIINDKKKHAPAQARNLLGIARRMFAWAKDQRIYGLGANPCSDLRPAKLIGDKHTGNRVLSDHELFALWRAAKRMPYPAGAVYQTLMLTALRLNEAADASWPEFDRQKRIWTIPAERMKGREGKARAHAVPLTEDLLRLLNALPRFTGKNSGDYVFSTSFGTKPVWISSKIKQEIDKRMLRTLRALARRRGDDPAKVVLPPWKNHDIRRTVRSQLSRLKVAEEVREAVLAHVRPGIKGVYDLHDYLDEKREALSLWATRLKSIVEPPPSNVIALRA